jgi:hypothetical protein
MKKFFLMIALLLMPVTAPIIVSPVQVQAYGGTYEQGYEMGYKTGLRTGNLELNYDRYFYRRSADYIAGFSNGLCDGVEEYEAVHGHINHI